MNSIAHFKSGINLGNSLDATGGETAWGNPPVTREMIDAYAKAGFTTLRIPVTWYGHMDTASGEVEPAWLSRVRQVVDWSLEAGMYTIINAHHENAWLHPSMETLSDVLPAYTALWKQICRTFQDCDSKLVFQGLNEPRVEHGENEKNGGTASVRAAINALNAAFVKTVRDSKGFNASRWLCIPPYNASVTRVTLDGMVIPQDDRLIVTVHFYKPKSFVSRQPTPGETPYFTSEAESAILEYFELVGEYQQKWDIPVMITEFGAESKYMPDSQQNNDCERAKYVSCFREHAARLGIPYIWWDNNYCHTYTDWFGLMDRMTTRWNCPIVAQALTRDIRISGDMV